MGALGPCICTTMPTLSLEKVRTVRYRPSHGLFATIGKTEECQPLLTEASAVVTSMAGCTTPNFAWMPLVSISISWRRMEN